MKIDNLLCVFDLETNGLDINTLDIIQISCLFIDPFRLTIIPGSHFNSYCRPDNIETIDDSDKKKEAMAISGITKEELRDKPVMKAVIPAFAAHIKKLCGRKKAIPCGYNICNFDLPIYNRLCKECGIADKEGKNPSFLSSTIFDMYSDISRWFFQSDKLLYPSFDSVRKLLGIDPTGAHRSDKDVRDEAEVVIRFLNLYKNLSKKITFEKY